MQFDDILKNHLGEFGRYQKVQYILVCLPTIFTALHALSWTFTGAIMKHRCLYPGEPNGTVYKVEQYSWLYNVTDAIPDIDKDRSCKRIAGLSFNGTIPGKDESYSLEPCVDGYAWDYTEMDLSAAKRWTLICDNLWIQAFIQAMYYIGQFFGSLWLGPLSDKIGRKKVFFLAIIIQIGCGAAMSYIPVWPVFAILRIGVGFAHPGIFVIAVVIGMELVGPSRRMLGGVASGMFFAVGQIILGLMAYGIRDFHLFQLAITLPALLFISYWWLVPESARWLLSQHRYQEADAVLQRAAKCNNATLPPNWYEQIEIDQKPAAGAAQPKKTGMIAGYASLFRTPNVRKRTILTSCICWPAVSMVYYGLAMNPGMMGGDNRLGFITGGILEIPCLLLVMVTINVVGRKFLCMTGFFLAGLCLILSMIIYWTAPAEAVKTGADSGYNTALMVLVVIGKSTLAGVYASIYIFTPELFPTTVRSTAMGLCSMIARVGGVAASFVAKFLAEKNKVAACVIFAILAILGGVACIPLPETAGQQLMETIEEAETFGTKLPMFKFMAKKKGGKEEKDKADEVLMRPMDGAVVVEDGTDTGKVIA